MNMKNTAHEETDRQIRQALEALADQVQITPAGFQNLCRSVDQRIEEKPKMKKWNVRRVVVAVAAICVLGSITAVAAGKITQTIGSSSHNEEINDYGQLPDMERQLGFTAKAPENFTNGYAFESAVPNHEEGQDADGNTVKQAVNLSLSYQKEGMNPIFISAADTKMYEEEETPDQTFSHGSVTLGYSCDDYLFLPPDAKPSKEDQAKADAGKLYISYGSDAEERRQYKSVLWEDQGISYILSSFDNTMSPEEFCQMAGEMIDMK